MGYARDQICRVAKAYAGTGASHNPDRYIALLGGTVESEAMKRAMLKMSSCALYARGVWREAGVNSEILNKPYVLGHAVSDIYAVAYSKNAWVKSDLNKHPQPGDVFIIYNNDSGSDAHVGTVVSTTPPSADGSIALGTVEGGQGAYGAESGAFVRTWIAKNNKYWMGARQVRGWVDADKLGIEEPKPIIIQEPAQTPKEVPIQNLSPVPANDTATPNKVPQVVVPALAATSAIAAILAILHNC